MIASGEFGFIEKIKSLFDCGPLKGIGDDCAIIPQKTGLETLVSTDMLVEGVHFLKDDISPYELGWKSAAVNFSDIAAMGGKPVGTFLSIALPKDLSEEWADGFISGFKALSDKFNTPLLGGDTTSSPGPICINVAILGECPCGRAKMRSSAIVGDYVYVTGNLGDSACGLKIILEGLEDDGHLVGKHHLPMPKISEGQRLSDIDGVHAMMDISDGIASDLRHILKASGVGAEIDLSRVPMSHEMLFCCEKYGWDAAELAVSGGEDYELLFTAAPSCALPAGCIRIGKIVEGADIKWIGSTKDYMGFRHF